MCGGEVSRRSPRLVPRGQTIMALPVAGTILLVGGPVYKGREFAVAANRRRLRVCDPLGAAYLRRSTVNLAYRWFCKLGIVSRKITAELMARSSSMRHYLQSMAKR